MLLTLLRKSVPQSHMDAGRQRWMQRQTRSKPLLDAFHAWAIAQRRRLSGKTPLGKALQYGLSRWDALTRYVDDGRLSIDNNLAERLLRGIAVTRKNFLFLGSDSGGDRAAILYTIIETCLCRPRHRVVYAARRTMPNGSGNNPWLSRCCRPSRDCWLRTIRHSSGAQSASRKASNRSLGRKRIRLPPWYGLSLANAASLSLRCACR